MGTSDYKKLKNDQQAAQKEKEDFHFRCIPGGRSFFWAVAAVFVSCAFTLLFQRVFYLRGAAVFFFCLLCAALFSLGVMGLLWCSTAVFYLLHRAKLKRNIQKLVKKEEAEKRLFEASYFKPLEEEEDSSNGEAS